MKNEDYEALIKETEVLLSRLHSLYEQWFQGIERHEPRLMKREAERRLKMLQQSQPRNTALRFRAQQVLQRFTTLNHHWTKVARQIEEGTYKRHVQRAKRLVKPQAPAEAAARPEGVDVGDLDLDFGTDADLEAMLAGLEAPAAKPASPQPPAAQLPTPAAPAGGPSAPVVAQPPPPAASAGGPSAPVARPTGGAPIAPPPASGVLRPAPPPPPAAGARPAPPPPPVAKPPASPSPSAAGPIAAPPPSSARIPVPPPSNPRIPAPPPSNPRIPAPPPNTAYIPPPPPSSARIPVPPPSNPRIPASPAKPEAPVAAPRPAVAASSASSSAGGSIDDTRMRAIYERYVDARKQNNERVDNVKFETVASSIEKMMPGLAEKHRGKNIDFEVVVKDGRVGLKPVAK